MPSGRKPNLRLVVNNDKARKRESKKAKQERELQEWRDLVHAEAAKTLVRGRCVALARFLEAEGLDGGQSIILLTHAAASIACETKVGPGGAAWPLKQRAAWYSRLQSQIARWRFRSEWEKENGPKDTA